MELRASFIQRREVEFDLHRSLVQPVSKSELMRVRLDVQNAKRLLYALRDALQQAGEDI